MILLSIYARSMILLALPVLAQAQVLRVINFILAMFSGFFVCQTSATVFALPQTAASRLIAANKENGTVEAFLNE